MGDDGSTKDDVKLPDGEIGDKIEKLFRTEEKDTSKSLSCVYMKKETYLYMQMLLFLLPWAKSVLWMPKKPLVDSRHYLEQS
jgi:hypothetical protein